MKPDQGAHFYRCDFQVHTPRDTNWQGSRATSDADRKAYAEHFVAACRDRDLNAVAITDHHDFVLFPYIKDAAESEQGTDGNRLPPKNDWSSFPVWNLHSACRARRYSFSTQSFQLTGCRRCLRSLGSTLSTPRLVRYRQSFGWTSYRTFQIFMICLTPDHG